MSATTLPAEDEALAAELALGVLVGDEARAAAARRAADPAFAREVTRWEVELAGMLDGIAAVPPPDALWPRIERSLDGGAVTVDLVARKLRRQRDLWRGYAATVSVAAAAMLVVVVARPVPIAPPPPPVAATAPAPMMSATLSGADGKPALVVNYQPGSHAIVVTPLGMPRASGHDHELWLIDAYGHSVAVGVMGGPAATHTMPMPGRKAMPLTGPVMVAVSEEPMGGSTTGRPSGPLVAKGMLSST